jgi:ferredoxin
MSLLLISVLVSVLILGGPLTLFALIKVSNQIFGGLQAKFVRVKVSAADSPALGLLVNWDDISFPHSVNRVKVDFVEIVRGGRSASFSFTFEDKSAKKRSFVIPMKLSAEDMAMLTDANIAPQGLKHSYVSVELENTKGETVRQKISKKKILEALAAAPLKPVNGEVDVLPETAPDSWSVLTRVFPWRKVVATDEAPKEKKVAKKDKSAAPSIVDFLVTKVWIEPGCIVCDACENEAPAVFKVLADTCIVVENADISDGAAVKAAAEGCPVDVIKYTTIPKPAA